MANVQESFPKWQCHKIVGAAQIVAILQNAGGTHLQFDEQPYAYTVTEEFVSRHKPKLNGYLVMYEDGYLSYSPQKAFEEGYTRLPTTPRN